MQTVEEKNKILLDKLVKAVSQATLTNDLTTWSIVEEIENEVLEAMKPKFIMPRA